MIATMNSRSVYVVARFAAALMSTSVLVVTGGSANAETPEWAQRCTENPWIRSGYCEARQAWSKYYCQCEFVPSYGSSGGSGGPPPASRDDDCRADDADNCGDDIVEDDDFSGDTTGDDEIGPPPI